MARPWTPHTIRKRAIPAGRAIRSSITRVRRRRGLSDRARHRDISSCSVRFRYLPSDYIHAFVGGNVKALTASAQSAVAQAEPLPRAAAPAAPVRRRQLSASDLRARRARRPRVARARPHRFCPRAITTTFAHELMVAQITASIELGTRDKPSVRLITWPEILANEHTPPATRASATPTAIRVTYSFRGRDARRARSTPMLSRSALSA